MVQFPINMASQEIGGIPFKSLIAPYKPSKDSVAAPHETKITQLTGDEAWEARQKYLDEWYETCRRLQIRNFPELLIYKSPPLIQRLIEKLVPRSWIEGYHWSKEPFNHPISRLRS